jgi:hypothetical protein
LGVSQPAHAILTVRFVQPGFGLVSVSDGGGGDVNPLPNAITIAVDYGSFTGFLPGTGLIINASTNSPATAQPNGFITNTTVEARNTSASAATLHVTTNATGFVDPGDAGDGMIVRTGLTAVNIVGTTTASVDSFFDLAPAGSAGPVTVDGTTPVAVDSDTVGVVRAGATYDLRNTLHITAGAGASSSITGRTDALLPAPASLLMALIGSPLVGLYYGLRRKFNQGRPAIA